MNVVKQQTNGRGRPRLAVPNVRIECMVPKHVVEVLIMREKLGHGYRTRIAARVLCDWAQSIRQNEAGFTECLGSGHQT
jgi:hypothetical protein